MRKSAIKIAMLRPKKEEILCLTELKEQTAKFKDEISLTPDFKYCKVKIALDSDDQNVLNQNLQVLQKSEGFIKRELAKMVDMPFMPKLNFVLDKGTSASVRVNES